jgi:hypothetical protein
VNGASSIREFILRFDKKGNVIDFFTGLKENNEYNDYLYNSVSNLGI